MTSARSFNKPLFQWYFVLTSASALTFALTFGRTPIRGYIRKNGPACLSASPLR
jgi:hypothetical protein